METVEINWDGIVEILADAEKNKELYHYFAEALDRTAPNGAGDPQKVRDVIATLENWAAGLKDRYGD